MALYVLCLVVIDLVILVTYTVVEGLRDNLGVKLTTNQELPKETFGVRLFRTSNCQNIYHDNMYM